MLAAGTGLKLSDFLGVFILILRSRIRKWLAQLQYDRKLLRIAFFIIQSFDRFRRTFNRSCGIL